MSENVTKVDVHFKAVAEMDLCGTAKLIALAIRMTGSISVDELMALTGQTRRVVQLYRAQYIALVDGALPTPRESCETREICFAKDAKDAKPVSQDAKNVSSSPARVEDNNITTNLETPVAQESKILLRSDEPKPKKQVHGTRLDPAWTLSEDLRQWTRTRFPQTTDQRLADELENFHDYWKAQAGQRGRKADWDATWRTWSKRAFATAPIRPRAADGERPVSSWEAEKAAKHARIRALMESVGGSA